MAVRVEQNRTNPGGRLSVLKWRPRQQMVAEPMPEKREARQIVAFENQPKNIGKRSRGTCDPRLYRFQISALPLKHPSPKVD